jgi:hypothetical protein
VPTINPAQRQKNKKVYKQNKNMVGKAVIKRTMAKALNPPKKHRQFDIKSHRLEQNLF